MACRCLGDTVRAAVTRTTIRFSSLIRIRGARYRGTPRCTVGLSCKIWYSICRTMSDCDVLCGNVNDRTVRAIAVKPRAFGAPLCGVGDLTDRPRRANEASRAANTDLHARCTARWSDIVR